MSNLITLSTNTDITRIIDALGALPRTLADGLVADLDRAGQEVAREMRLAAPKAFSNLAQSVRMERDSVTSRWVGPGVNYALAVERGTGPAAGQPAYFPNVDALQPWAKLRAGITLRNTRQGSKARQVQLDDIRDRAWALARHIARAGTRAQPYVAPTAAKMAPRIADILAAGVQRNVRELGRQA